MSRESPLSGELCEEDRECNQVEDPATAPEPVAAQPKPGMQSYLSICLGSETS